MSTASSNISAVDLLSTVKARTNSNTYLRFIKILRMYKRRELTREACCVHVSQLFQDEPELLNMFKLFLSDNISEYSYCVDFVNRVKSESTDSVYQQFILLMREYQSCPRASVCLSDLGDRKGGINFCRSSTIPCGVSTVQQKVINSK